MSKKKRIFKKIYIALFVAMISLPWFVWAGVRVFAPEFYAEQSDLSREKRNKNELNLRELIRSGENLSLYVDDRVPFRGGMIDVYQDAEGKTEKAYQDALRKVIALFPGSTPGQKEVADYSSMFDSARDETSDNPGSDDETPSEGLSHEHNLVAIDVVKPDCENPGYTLYKCLNCDYRTKEYRDPLGHDNMLIKESEASYESYGYKQYICRVCGKFSLKDFVPKYVDTSYMAPQVMGGTTLIGRYNWLFYAGNNLKYYTGENLLTEDDLTHYGSLVNRLKELCDERGITPILMFMPNKEQVYPEFLPNLDVVSERKREQQLSDYINANTDVTCLYPLEELKSADIYWQTYYKYDTHWNYVGAFIGLQTFYKSIGAEVTNPLLLTSSMAEAPRYDLILLAGLSVENYPTDMECIFDYHNDIYVEGYDQYAGITHTHSTSSNACKLVMLSDSYREMMTPFMVKDFSECVIAHRDYTDSVAEDIKNCNVLFITAVERDDWKAFKCIEKVISILEQQ